MKTYHVLNSDGVEPFHERYEANNKVEALKMFIKESEELVKDLKNIKFTFELDEDFEIVREYTDGEYSGDYIVKELEILKRGA